MLNSIRGRETRSQSTIVIIIKTLLQTVIFWTIFLLVLPYLVQTAEMFLGYQVWPFDPQRSFWFGLGLFVVGGTLGITSGLVMALQGRGTPLPSDCARRLVIVGPYRHVRNPMAIAGLAQGVAVGIMMGSPAVIAVSLLGGPLWDGFVRPWEEADLERRFGEPYRDYRAQVGCWWPRLRGYRAAEAGPVRQVEETVETPVGMS